MSHRIENFNQRVEEFTKRFDSEYDYCLELFEYATIRLMAHKYAYYILNGHFVEDNTYTGEENTWYVMGIALGLLSEEESSPCIDWDSKHPYAEKGIAYANTLKVIK